MRFEQQLINKSHKHSKNTLGAKVATATKPEGEGTAGVIAFKASGAKLLQDKKGCGQAFCSTATHSAKAFPLTSLTPTQHPTSTLPQTSDGTISSLLWPCLIAASSGLRGLELHKPETLGDQHRPQASGMQRPVFGRMTGVRT